MLAAVVYAASVYAPSAPVQAFVFQYDGDFVFPESSVRRLTREELNSVTSYNIAEIARHEIYAREGCYNFRDEMKDYFNSKDWYTDKGVEFSAADKKFEGGPAGYNITKLCERELEIISNKPIDEMPGETESSAEPVGGGSGDTPPSPSPTAQQQPAETAETDEPADDAPYHNLIFLIDIAAFSRGKLETGDAEKLMSGFCDKMAGGTGAAVYPKVVFFDEEGQKVEGRLGDIRGSGGAMSDTTRFSLALNTEKGAGKAVLDEAERNAKNANVNTEIVLITQKDNNAADRDKDAVTADFAHRLYDAGASLRAVLIDGSEPDGADFFKRISSIANTGIEDANGGSVHIYTDSQKAQDWIDGLFSYALSMNISYKVPIEGDDDNALFITAQAVNPEGGVVTDPDVYNAMSAEVSLRLANDKDAAFASSGMSVLSSGNAYAVYFYLQQEGVYEVHVQLKKDGAVIAHTQKDVYFSPMNAVGIYDGAGASANKGKAAEAWLPFETYGKVYAGKPREFIVSLGYGAKEQLYFFPDEASFGELDVEYYCKLFKYKIAGSDGKSELEGDAVSAVWNADRKTFTANVSFDKPGAYGLDAVVGIIAGGAVLEGAEVRSFRMTIDAASENLLERAFNSKERAAILIIAGIIAAVTATSFAAARVAAGKRLRGCVSVFPTNSPEHKAVISLGSAVTAAAGGKREKLNGSLTRMLDLLEKSGGISAETHKAIRDNTDADVTFKMAGDRLKLLWATRSKDVTFDGGTDAGERLLKKGRVVYGRTIAAGETLLVVDMSKAAQASQARYITMTFTKP